ncbi:MAG: cytochrome P450 [Pseudomonadota bacterium]
MIPTVEQDPLEPDFVANPFPRYADWRAKGDFVFWAEYGLPVATTHSAVTQTLRHPAMGRARPGAMSLSANDSLSPFEALERHSLLELEPPDHTRLRRLALKAFTGPLIAMMAPKISQFADQLIDAFPDGPFDLIEHFSKPLAALTVTEFLGVDTGSAPQLQDWSTRMVAMYQARRDATVEADANAAAEDFTRFMANLVETRRRAPQQDFLSEMVTVQSTGGLSIEELISTAILLLNAGHEATVHAVGNAVPLLIDFENRADALSIDGITGTVEECLRYKPPLHLFKRYVYKSTNVDDVTFDENDEVACLLASASHDDAVWPDGEVFDPFRPLVRHLAFGSGLHSCVGATLARLEMKIGLPLLFSRCGDLQMTEPPRIANKYHFHGYEKLMVKTTKAGPASI